MPAKTNTFKAALRGSRMLAGCWLNLGHAITADMAGDAGFDWCLIDGEHSPYDIEMIRTQLLALAAHDTPAIVRLPAHDNWMIKQLLDAGANSILAPMVNTAAEARAIVRATRYPPGGVRGVGATLSPVSRYDDIEDYFVTANDQICVVVQIESQQALANIAEIAAVDGVDALFIGPADLSADMGYLANHTAPAPRAAVEEGIARIQATGKPAGMLSFDPGEIEYFRGLGVRMLAITADMHAMITGLREMARLGRG